VEGSREPGAGCRVSAVLVATGDWVGIRVPAAASGPLVRAVQSGCDRNMRALTSSSAHHSGEQGETVAFLQDRSNAETRLDHAVGVCSKLPSFQQATGATEEQTVTVSPVCVCVCILTVIEHGSPDPGPADDKLSRTAPCRGTSGSPVGRRDLPTADPGRRTAQKSFIAFC
jgi:hypothetical protein